MSFRPLSMFLFLFMAMFASNPAVADTTTPAIPVGNTFDYSVSHSDVDMKAEALSLMTASNCRKYDQVTERDGYVDLFKMFAEVVRFTYVHPGQQVAVVSRLQGGQNVCTGLTAGVGSVWNPQTHRLLLGNDLATSGQVNRVSSRVTQLTTEFEVFEARVSAQADRATEDAAAALSAARTSLNQSAAAMDASNAAVNTAGSARVDAANAKSIATQAVEVATEAGRLATAANDKANVTKANVARLTTRTEDLEGINDRHIQGRVAVFGGGGQQSPALLNEATGNMVRPANIWTVGLDGSIVGYPDHGNVIVGLGGFVGAIPGPGVWAGPKATGGYSFNLKGFDIDALADLGYAFGASAYKNNVDGGLVADRGWFGAFRLDYRPNRAVFVGVGVRGNRGLVEFPADQIGKPDEVEKAWRLVGAGELGVIF